tara:strand:- start:102 stop:665 length:564 start_codon:yes stop_codon:yes gene_type:complete
MLHQQTLFVHKFDVLYNILYEIRNILTFNLKSVNNSEISKILEDKNCLIISSEKNFNLNSKVIFLDYPLNLVKLIEIININFLKNRFNQQNNIKIGKYSINLNSRIMKKNKEEISLTEKESQIITFLNISIKPITIIDLQKEVWGHKSKLETHTVETHIYRLRKKIEKKFKDKTFICSHKDGYKLNA